MSESNASNRAVCVKCEIEKEVTEFRQDKSKGGYNTVAPCKKCHASYMRAHRFMNKDNQMIIDARHRAKKAGLPFNLEYGDLEIPRFCPLLGIPIIKGEGKHAPNSPSLDRIDPDEGYTKENVWVVSHRANKIKNDATVEELFTIANNLRIKIDEDNMH